MGITTVVFTLVAGIMSLRGGDLMSIDIRAPFYIVIAASLTGLAVLETARARPETRQITRVQLLS